MAAGILLLALGETASALLAPHLAPSDADWASVEKAVRAGFRPGDLIVAAPAWSDQVLRLHLGDLIPLPVAARLDAARFGRIWQVSQRGAAAPEVQAAGSKLAQENRHGALRVTLYERPAARVTYDFVQQWPKARVARLEPGRGEIPCERLPDRHQCPNIGFNFVKSQVLEMEATLHLALLAQPVGGATVVIEYPNVSLGRELAIGAGLHNVWWRRTGDGTVALKVLIDGVLIASDEAGNRTGWRVSRIDTRALAGKTATVRFEISCAKPYGRMYGFAAEARD